MTSGVLATALLLLAGCVGGLQTSRVPVNIGFKPVIGHDTRAEESVPFPEDRTFRVWALNEDDGEVYLDNEEIAHSEGWLASKVWPQASLTFDACWPVDLDVDHDRDNGLSISGFDSSEGDVDILFARTEDETYEVDSLINLRFDHILSRVEFRIQQSLPAEMSVEITGIELNGFAQTGDYNTTGDYTWKTKDATRSFTVFDGSDNPVRISSDPIYIGEDFYAIPQHCQASVKVCFDVKYGDAEWIPQEAVIDNIDTQWKPSTHYTYTLTLTDEKMVYTTGISNWNNRDE